MLSSHLTIFVVCIGVGMNIYVYRRQFSFYSIFCGET
jgi:hypothetical protein